MRKRTFGLRAAANLVGEFDVDEGFDIGDYPLSNQISKSKYQKDKAKRKTLPCDPAF